MSQPQSQSLRRGLPIVAVVAALALAAPAGAALFIYAGLYDIGADAPHTKPVFWLIEQLRDRSIAVRARRVAPPADLASAARVAAGARVYDSLCAGCHLAPGVGRTDLSRGLYPKAPQLAYGTNLSPREEFWVVKHGIKLTAMPAWGRTHNDDELWDVIAFLGEMPLLDPEQYQTATAAAFPGK